MAKKKAKPKTKSKILTDKDVDDLAKRLHGSTANVYRIAEEMFGVKVGDEVFPRLEAIGKVFRCEECDEWLGVSCKDPGRESCCTPCVEDEEAEEFDDEEVDSQDDYL